ncbi:1331_t:CDS:2 [Gigaspora rosea]|nr:1331_t:CDS:2 [Gigaspora rosea]
MYQNVLECTFSIEERVLILLTNTEANNDKAGNKTDNEPEKEFGEESESAPELDFVLRIGTPDDLLSLVDDVEEDQINNEILEEESAEFKGFDSKYGLFFKILRL